MIEAYSGRLDEEIRELILGIQNNEAKIGLFLAEQPDLLDIANCYKKSGGGFWLALDDGKLIGTIRLMMAQNGCAVMKKFFVDAQYRSQGVGLALYKTLIEHAVNAGVKCVILDTPSVARFSQVLRKSRLSAYLPRKPAH